MPTITDDPQDALYAHGNGKSSSELSNLHSPVAEPASFTVAGFRAPGLSHLGRRLASNVLWTLCGSVLARAIGLITWILTARALGATAYGQFGMLQTTVGMFGTFAGLGLGVTATKYLAECRTKAPARARRILALSQILAFLAALTGASLIFFLAPWLCSKVLSGPNMTASMRISAALLFFTVTTGAQTAALAGLERFRSIAIIDTTSMIVGIFCIVAGARIAQVEGAITGLCFSSCIAWILNSWVLSSALKDTSRPSLREVWGERRILLTFSLPALFGSLMIAPINWLSATMLVNAHRGYFEMGLFNAANQWRAAILLIPGSVGLAFLPILSNLHGDGRITSFRRLLRYNVLASGLIAGSVAVVVAASAKFIMSRYGPQFSGGSTVLILVVCASAVIAVNNVFSRAFASAGLMWRSFGFDLVWGASYLLCSALLVRRHAASGLAMALLIASAVQLLWQCLHLPFLTRAIVDPHRAAE